MKEFTEELKQEVKRMGIEKNLKVCEKCDTYYLLTKKEASNLSFYEIVECEKCNSENTTVIQPYPMLFWDI